MADYSIALQAGKGTGGPNIMNALAQAQVLQMGRLKMEEAARERQEQNMLRQLVQGGVDLTSPEGIKRASMISPQLGLKMQVGALAMDKDRRAAQKDEVSTQGEMQKQRLAQFEHLRNMIPSITAENYGAWRTQVALTFPELDRVLEPQYPGPERMGKYAMDAKAMVQQAQAKPPRVLIDNVQGPVAIEADGSGYRPIPQAGGPPAGAPAGGAAISQLQPDAIYPSPTARAVAARGAQYAPREQAEFDGGLPPQATDMPRNAMAGSTAPRQNMMLPQGADAALRAATVQPTERQAQAAAGKAADTAADLGVKQQFTQAEKVRDLDLATTALDEALRILPKATSGGLQAAGAGAVGFFGQSTRGSEASARLDVLHGQIKPVLDRAKGDLNEREVENIEKASAQLANRSIPVGDRLVAARELLKVLQAKRAVLSGDKAASAAGAGGFALPQKVLDIMKKYEGQ